MKDPDSSTRKKKTTVVPSTASRRRNAAAGGSEEAYDVNEEDEWDPESDDDTSNGPRARAQQRKSRAPGKQVGEEIPEDPGPPRQRLSERDTTQDSLCASFNPAPMVGRAQDDTSGVPKDDIDQLLAW